MKASSPCRLVLVTAPNLQLARTLAGRALAAKLIACANLLPKMESHYRWRGKVEHSAEVLLILKTTRACLGKLEKLVVRVHPYETPEYVVLTLSGGNGRYLKWLEDSVR